MEQSSYSAVFGDLIAWNASLREKGTNVKTASKSKDQQICLEIQREGNFIYPVIEQYLDQMARNGQLVDPHKLNNYPYSNFSMLHVALQDSRRLAITETLSRVEYFKDVPANIGDRIDFAKQQLETTPDTIAPSLDIETLANLSDVPDMNPMVWDQVRQSLEAQWVLLAEVVASKAIHSGSVTQLPNRRVVQISNMMLGVLDTLASCTPWQWDEEADRQEYFQRVSLATQKYIQADIRLGLARKLTGDNRVWSADFWIKPENKRYLEAVRTGQLPLAKVSRPSSI